MLYKQDMVAGVLALRGPIGPPMALTERAVVATMIVRPEPQRREAPPNRPDPRPAQAQAKQQSSTRFRFQARPPRPPIEPLLVGRGPAAYNRFAEPTAPDLPPALLDVYA
jgi:hypothetical protein